MGGVKRTEGEKSGRLVFGWLDGAAPAESVESVGSVGSTIPSTNSNRESRFSSGNPESASCLGRFAAI
jgi:hypothetical protein